MKCLNILFAILAVQLLVSSCEPKVRDVAQVIRDKDSTQVDFVGSEFTNAFKSHIVNNYNGQDIFSVVGEKPFLFYHLDQVFKMDIDTGIVYQDSLIVIRFHGALDTLIEFSCHICSAPQSLAVFVKRQNGYWLKGLVDASRLFTCPWGSSTILELHFEDSGWPGPMLFSFHSDGGQGNFYQYVNAVDLSPYSLGFERFKFSNMIRHEMIFLPDFEDLSFHGFPHESVASKWKEAFKVSEKEITFRFNEEDHSFNIVRDTKVHWDIWIGPELENNQEIVVSDYVDTLNFTLQGGIFSMK